MKKSFPDLLIVLLFVGINVGYLSFPPGDQDVGGITYNAMLINNGLVPYRESFEQKLPGAFFIVSFALRVFGQSTLGLNLAAMFWNLCHLLVIMWGVRKLWGRGPALWAGAAFVLAVTAKVVGGTSPNYELWMGFPLTAGLLLLIAGRTAGLGRFMVAGALVATGILVKQQAALSAIVLAVWFVSELKNPRRAVERAAAMALGTLAAVFPIILFFVWHGELRTFLVMVNPRSALTYASGGGASPSVIWEIARHETMRVFHAMPFLFYAGSAFLLLVVVRLIRRQRVERPVWLLLTWCLGAIAGISAGMRFYTHYFIQAIPPLCVAGGWIAYQLKPSFRENGFRAASMSLLIVILLWTSGGEFLDHVQMAWWQAKYSLTKRSMPMLSQQRMAQIISDNTAPGEPILVWGHRENMYLLVNRLAPTRFYKYWAFMAPPSVKYTAPELNPNAMDHVERFIEEVAGTPPGAILVATDKHDAPTSTIPVFHDWLISNYNRTAAFDYMELWLPTSERRGRGEEGIEGSGKRERTSDIERRRNS